MLAAALQCRDQRAGTVGEFYCCESVWLASTVNLGSLRGGLVIVARRVAALAVALILAGCGSAPPAPTSAGPTRSAIAGPTASPTGSAIAGLTGSPLPALSASITESGGKVEIPDGPMLSVPAGGLPAGSTVTIAALASPPGPTSALPGSLLGHAWSVDTGGTGLTGTATLTLRFDPAALPAGTGPAGVILASFDTLAATWAPVDATVDPAAGTVTARVEHLSTWAVLVVTAATEGGTFAFPYAAGVSVELGRKGLHDTNFSCLDSRTSGDHCAAGYVPLAGAAATGTAIDLLAAEGTAVLPLAAGTVLAASPYCQTVLVDHGSGVWVEYVHLNPSVVAGQSAVRSKPLGTVAAAWPAPTYAGPCGLYSDKPHLHFAFLRPDPATGKETFMSMTGAVLCGHAVTSSGGIEGLATGPGKSFPVPTCPGDSTPTPTPVVYGQLKATVSCLKQVGWTTPDTKTVFYTPLLKITY